MSCALKRVLFTHFKPIEKKEKKLKFLCICQSLKKMEFALWFKMPNKTTINFGCWDQHYQAMEALPYSENVTFRPI